LVCRLTAEVKFSVLGHDLGKDVLSKSLANFERSRRVHAGPPHNSPTMILTERLFDTFGGFKKFSSRRSERRGNQPFQE
jgi:hypothetical protein